MNKIDFAYFMEEYLQEERTDIRSPWAYAPYQTKGEPPIEKLQQRDMDKQIAKGLRTPKGALTAKGRHYKDSSSNRESAYSFNK